MKCCPISQFPTTFASIFRKKKNHIRKHTLFHSEGIIVSTNNTRSENLTNTVLAMRPAYKVNSALAVLIRFVPLHTLWRTAHNQVVQTSSNITQYILSLIFHFSLTYTILVMHARTQCRSIVVFCGQLCNLAQTPSGSLPFSLHGSPPRLLRLPIPFFCGWSPKHSHSWGGGQWYSVCMSNPPPSCFVFIQIVACEARYRHIIRASVYRPTVAFFICWTGPEPAP